MKLKKIMVENFKSIKALVYSPKNVTAALIGHNGVGKTAFKEAVYALLSGNFPDNCINNEADFCSVSAIFDDDGTEFKRTQNRYSSNEVRVDDRKTTGKALGELMESKTGMPMSKLKLVSSAEVVEGLSSADFGELVLSSIPEEMDFDTLKSHISTLDPDVEKVLAELFPAMPDKFAVGNLSQAYNVAFDQRKFLNKSVQIAESKVLGFVGKEPDRPLANVEADYASIIAKESSAASKITAMNLYQDAVKNRVLAENAIKTLEAKITALSATRPNPNELKDIKDKINECNKNIITAKTMIGTFNENVVVFQNTLNNLEKPVCPISEKLVCTTDKTKIKEELQEIIFSNKEGIDVQRELIDKENGKLAKLEISKLEFEDNEKRYNQKVLLSSQLEEQKRNLPVIPAKPDDPDDSAYDYTSEKSKLAKERAVCIEYEAHLKDIREFEVVKHKLDIYETVCTILKPKGEVMSSIMAHYMAIFETVCNKRAAEIKPGLELKFNAIEGVSYEVRHNATAAFKPYASLSSGERAIAMFIVLDMLNQLNQQRVLMLDDLDKLDSDAFKELMVVIQSPDVQASYDHIFIMAVDHEDILKTLKGFKAIDYI